MTVADLLLVISFGLLIWQMWRLCSRIDRLIELHSSNLDRIAEAIGNQRTALEGQDRFNQHVAKVLGIMCSLWPRANDRIVEAWALDAKDEQA